ncbi:hypothetical protein K488DRAFT_84334 [Vararia minispora EC-137]|uniref:Uncharacterized protein n=1 Tax=Vararia minispora EC-137 TaxID=1314806 RepID=A0ACB8QQH5_9AGAM|nr:hypothetical protein K488DRAFT_84334 [Vararia minispora EC-137]
MSPDDAMELDDDSFSSSQFPLPSSYLPQDTTGKVAWQASQNANPSLRALLEQAKEDREMSSREMTSRRRSVGGPIEDVSGSASTSVSASHPVRSRARGDRARGLDRTKSGSLPSLSGGPSGFLDALKDVTQKLDETAKQKRMLLDKIRHKDRKKPANKAGTKRKLKSHSQSPVSDAPSSELPAGTSTTTRTRSLGAVQDLSGSNANFILSMRYHSMPNVLQHYPLDETMTMDTETSCTIEPNSPLPDDSRLTSFSTNTDSPHSMSSESNSASQSTTPPASPRRPKQAQQRPLGKFIVSSTALPSRTSTPTVRDKFTSGPARPMASVETLRISPTQTTPALRNTTPGHPSKLTPRLSPSRPSVERIKCIAAASQELSDDNLPPPLALHPAASTSASARTAPSVAHQALPASYTAVRPGPATARPGPASRSTSIMTQAPRPSQRPPVLGMRGVGASTRYTSNSQAATQSTSHKIPAFRPPLLQTHSTPVAQSAASSVQGAAPAAQSSNSKLATQMRALTHAPRASQVPTPEPSPSPLGLQVNSETGLSCKQTRAETPEPHIEADSSYGEISLDEDELHAVLSRYD